MIEHVDDIVDMRRYLALAEGDLPPSLATTLTNIERAGNPWKQPKRRRAAWTQGLDFAVPLMRDFSFTAPQAPWSYAGHHISIIWEVTVTVDIPWSPDAAWSERIILRPPASAA